jgi:hypothetical protein
MAEAREKKISPIRLSPKKEMKVKRRNSKGSGKSDPLPQLQNFKLIKLNEGCSRRSRKTINYMKLNEGILCENERH